MSEGPQRFVKGPPQARQFVKAPVRRETVIEEVIRQFAFTDDCKYIYNNLRPGEPVFFTYITKGATSR